MKRGGGNPVDRHVTGRLLAAGKYEQVAEFIQKAQTASEQAGDTVLANILDAAHRICLACSQFQAEADWHRRAGENAGQRERELQQQLVTILQLVNGCEASGTGKTPSAAPPVELRNPKRQAGEPAGHHGLWRRLRGLVKRKPSLLPPERPASAASLGTPIEALPLSSPDKTESPAAAPVKKGESKEQASPSLAVYCLGPFRVYQDDQPVADWPSSKGKAIFKYLVTHRERPVVKEVLMELFWPEAHPDAARNNLNVAIYGLRQALRQTHPSFSHVLFRDDCYLLDPGLSIWVDCEAFMEHLAAAQALERRGEPVAAMREYHAAEALYQGEFMGEDRYEDWPIPHRQRLQRDYLALLERLSDYHLNRQEHAACATVCNKMLAVDPCREGAHRRLMRCYSRQGQPYLALRQYHLCVEALREELDVSPAQTTMALYDQIRQGKQI